MVEFSGKCARSSHLSLSHLFICSIDIDNKKIEMTFRSESRRQDQSPVLTHSDLKEGQIVNGRVKKIEDYGLFLEIEGSKLSGLCHKSEVR
jgi:rRNA biogenesis protein RRP5